MAAGQDAVVTLVAPKTIIAEQRPPAIVAPTPAASGSLQELGRQLITVIIKASGEKERDVRRMRRIHGLLNSFPGQDRFCFLVFERGHQHLLDFPNDTTAASQELLNKLIELVGQDNVQVEPV